MISTKRGAGGRGREGGDWLGAGGRVWVGNNMRSEAGKPAWVNKKPKAVTQELPTNQ